MSSLFCSLNWIVQVLACLYSAHIALSLHLPWRWGVFYMFPVGAPLSYSNSEKSGKTPDDRKAIFDIDCQGMKGEHFIRSVVN